MHFYLYRIHLHTPLPCLGREASDSCRNDQGLMDRKWVECFKRCGYGQLHDPYYQSITQCLLDETSSGLGNTEYHGQRVHNKITIDARLDAMNLREDLNFFLLFDPNPTFSWETSVASPIPTSKLPHILNTGSA